MLSTSSTKAKITPLITYGVEGNPAGCFAAFQAGLRLERFPESFITVSPFDSPLLNKKGHLLVAFLE